MNCPKCGQPAILVDPADDTLLDPDDYEPDAEVWVCSFSCSDWSQEATLDESLGEAVANLEWLAERLTGGAS